MMRTLGSLGLACVLAATFAGCGDGDGGGGRGGDDKGGSHLVDDAERRADAAIDGVVHDIAAALDLTFGTGGRHFAICGETYAPGGVQMLNFLNFEPGGLPDDEAVAAASRALEDDGWKVTRPGNPAIVDGEKDGLTLRVELGAGAVVIDLTSTCLDTSDDVARETQERPRAEITWQDG